MAFSGSSIGVEQSRLIRPREKNAILVGVLTLVVIPF